MTFTGTQNELVNEFMKIAKEARAQAERKDTKFSTRSRLLEKAHAWEQAAEMLLSTTFTEIRK